MNTQHTDPVLEQAAQWHVRLKEAPRDELEEFQLWLSADKTHSRAFESIQKISGDMDMLSGMSRTAPEILPPGLAASIEECRDLIEPQKKPLIRWLGAVAAAALILVFVLQGGLPASGPDIYRTAVGEKKNIMLSDGSTITLNTDTLLSVVMTGGARRLFLEKGEAYFNVAKDKTRPFVVATGNGFIRAVGTAFNIRHRDNKKVHVTVYEGRVEVDAGAVLVGPETAEKIPRFLDAGEQITYGGSAVQMVSLARNDLGRAALWREGRVIFEATPLRDVVSEIQPYVATKIVIADEIVGGYLAGGVFRTDNVDMLLRGLEIALPVRVIREKNVIILTRRTENNE